MDVSWSSMKKKKEKYLWKSLYEFSTIKPVNQSILQSNELGQKSTSSSLVQTNHRARIFETFESVEKKKRKEGRKEGKEKKRQKLTFDPFDKYYRMNDLSSFPSLSDDEILHVKISSGLLFCNL